MEFLGLTICLLLPSIVGLFQPKNLFSFESKMSNYDQFSFDPSKGDYKIDNWHQIGHYRSTGRRYSAWVAIIHRPIDFHIVLPNDSCNQVSKTSTTAQEHKCDYAVNGGFFDIDGHHCIGNVVSDGNYVELPASSTANWAIAKNSSSGEHSVLVGFLSNSDLSNSSYKFLQLVSGLGWLVRNGKSYVNSSMDLDPRSSFVTEKAPRTALGLFSNNSILILEVDGEEDIKLGPDLFEMTELLLSLQVQTAVNLDGGGSSVSVKDGKIISTPHCYDTPIICERPVTSIVCGRQ